MKKTINNIKKIIIKSKEIIVDNFKSKDIIIGKIHDAKSIVIKEFYKFRDICGILGVSALLAVLIKFIVFYSLMGVTSGFLSAYLISLIITYLIFKMPRNKLIPAIIFCVLSLLMFCDVTYNSFFNRYLSIGMLGAAEVVGDIGDSIKAIMRPVNFLMLIDAALALATALNLRSKERRGNIDEELDIENCQDPNAETYSNADTEGDTDIALYNEDTDFNDDEDTGLNGDSETGDDADIELKKESDLNDEGIELQCQSDSDAVYENDILNSNTRISRLCQKLMINQEKRLKAISYGKKFSSLLLILAILIGNLMGIGLFKSITNQEFYTFHVKDIISSIFSSENDNLATMTDHYQNEKDGPLFGIAEGKNLVVIQLESFQNFTVGMEYNGEEITPNINKLLEGNTTYFDNFYQQIGSGNTSDAEFATNNSLYGSLTSYTYKLYEENYFRGLPVMLKERGYNTSVYHAAEDREFWNRENMYPAQGFDRYYGGLKPNGGDYEMIEWMGWGLTDSEFMKQTVNYMKEIEEPYYNFVITISNHHPYKMLNKYKFVELMPRDRGTIVGNYIQSAAYTDYSLGLFMDLLKKEGMYEDTVFVIYGDHVGMTHSEEIDKGMGKLLGKAYDFQDMMSVPLIIHIPGESEDIHNTISTAGGQTDIFPTLAYLFGFEELDTLYVGHNLYTIKEGLVAEQTMMTKGSFFSNEIAYEMSRDGIFENGRAWNIRTGEEVDVASCYANHLKSIQIIENSEYILRSDAIRKIFLQGESIGSISDLEMSRLYPDEIVIAGYPKNGLKGSDSKEALDYSVYAGYKNIRLDVRWNSKGEPYTVNARTGKKEMSGEDIAAWMAAHGSINIYFNVKDKGDALVEYLADKNKIIAERTVLELSSQSEYTGNYEAVLNISETGLTANQVKAFIKAKKPWAILIDQNDVQQKYANILNEEVQIYILDKSEGIVKKAD
ncbi:MAG: LTA synthase family protein [Eubacteriales bacterium]|nr:LTA synthase family protein [Eubacteriales bacterium]